jgi:hypothetical protein
MAMKHFTFKHKIEDFYNLLATDEKFRKIMSKYETEGRSEVIDNNGYIHIWNVELEANDKDVCYMVNALTSIEHLFM